MTIKDITDTLTTNPDKKYSKRYFNKIEYIAIHHTVSKGSIESMAKYHVNERGWPGIGYHFVIDKNAIINQTNRLDTICYNVSNTNTKVVGVAVIGNFEKDYLTTEQKMALIEIIDLLKKLIGRDIQVRPHNSFKNTLCPGEHISEFIDKLNNGLYE